MRFLALLMHAFGKKTNNFLGVWIQNIILLDFVAYAAVLALRQRIRTYGEKNFGKIKIDGSVRLAVSIGESENERRLPKLCQASRRWHKNFINLSSTLAGADGGVGQLVRPQRKVTAWWRIVRVLLCIVQYTIIKSKKRWGPGVLAVKSVLHVFDEPFDMIQPIRDTRPRPQHCTHDLNENNNQCQHYRKYQCMITNSMHDKSKIIMNIKL